MRKLYAIKDGEKSVSPFEVSSLDEAKRLNEQRFGIFWAVNDFGEASRKIINLKRINSWFIEMDAKDVSKEVQLLKIRNSPLVPSLVVESKNGYHVYWDAKDATQSSFKTIETGLVNLFGADPKGALLTQLARVPGFYHWKDANDPFLVTEVFSAEVSYREQAMLHFFPYVPPHVRKDPPPQERINLETLEGSLAQKLSHLNHEVALAILSGKACVNGERYEFEPVARGRKNILVNGKSTSCFIDEHKMIGATPGGPTIWQWLKYYGHSDRDVAIIIMEELGL